MISDDHRSERISNPLDGGVQAILDGTQTLDFVPAASPDEHREWVASVLRRFRYRQITSGIPPPTIKLPKLHLIHGTSSIRLPVTTSLTGSVFFHCDFGITSCHSAPA